MAGRRVADLCAAPGGKTAGLAAAGAAVTAVDISPKRLDRLRANLQRLQTKVRESADIHVVNTRMPADLQALTRHKVGRERADVYEES